MGQRDDFFLSTSYTQDAAENTKPYKRYAKCFSCSDMSSPATSADTLIMQNPVPKEDITFETPMQVNLTSGFLIRSSSLVHMHVNS